MHIRKHPSNNGNFGAPNDMQDGSCAGLPVTTTRDEYGIWHNSFWKPTAAELAALNAGGSLVLQIRGPGHPVVALGVTPEETQPHSLIEFDTSTVTS